MLCDECKKNAATVHISRVVNNEKQEWHLCPACAEKHGSFQFPLEPTFSINSLLAGLLNQEMDYTGGTVQIPARERCENCGCSFADFRQTGRLGCSECYAVFAPKLEPILRRIHGSSNHTGKVPARSGGRARHRREIDRLRAELQKLIDREEFEKAAEIRDAIREMESQQDLENTEQ
jgi:protein arginine kinase activator